MLCRTCCFYIVDQLMQEAHVFADACNALQGTTFAERTGYCAGTWRLRGNLAVAGGNINNVAELSTAHIVCSEKTCRTAAAMVHAENDGQDSICTYPLCRQWPPHLICSAVTSCSASSPERSCRSNCSTMSSSIMTDCSGVAWAPLNECASRRG